MYKEDFRVQYGKYLVKRLEYTTDDDHPILCGGCVVSKKKNARLTIILCMVKVYTKFKRAKCYCYALKSVCDMYMKDPKNCNSSGNGTYP